MRLLLDELYSRRIAEELRRKGHDVVCASERDDLRGLPDAELFEAARAERRALVTENWGDFRTLLEQSAAAGTAHFGVLFTSRRRLPRSAETIGLYVRVLDELLSGHRAEDALRDEVRWLPAD